jgi:hypothetical protein
MHKGQKPNFNHDYVKSVSKEEFIKNHEAAYPDVDLEAEYHKIVPAEKAKKAGHK